MNNSTICFYKFCSRLLKLYFQVDVVIEDMYEGFRDGTNLLLLLEILSEEKLVKIVLLIVLHVI
jgi:hypothetical protein